MRRKRLLVLGSTGSVGENALDVARNLSGELEVVALAARSSWNRLLQQVLEFQPAAVCLTDRAAASPFRRALGETRRRHASLRAPRIYTGPDGLVAMVEETQGDVLLAAISGAAGLPANVAALESGKDLALANKESLVSSGAVLTRLARDRGRRILPVDSEHSAIFQSLQAGARHEVRAIVLTASGGPFRSTPAAELAAVTPQQALRHPTWQMGAKITIDSATLMNKALEVIEAHWLFELPPEQIEVVIHPQSIVHSLVEFHDGSTICQLGVPDMRVPIQYALTYPQRLPLPVARLRLAEIRQLTFEEPDPTRFPALRLAYEVLRAGGTAPAVFNAANEVAVAAFLAGHLPFPGILATVEGTLSAHSNRPATSLQSVLEADRWARGEARRQVARELPARVEREEKMDTPVL